MSNVKLTIDNKEISVPSSYTVLQAAKEAGIYIPTLCYLEGIHEESSCRVCVVEIEGQRTLKNSCKMPVAEGMVVRTNTERVTNSVVTNLQLTSANHTFECWTCSREHNCELLDLLRRFDVENVIGENPHHEKRERIINDSSNAIVLDSGKCTLCGRCVSACKKQAGVEVLGLNNRGSETIVGPSGLNCMSDSGCIYCGKCIQACPVAAIKEKDEFREVNEVLKDPTKKVVVQAAPSVRVALGEEFGMPIGTNVEGKMYAALAKLGFDEIGDVNYGADLTIMEEGTEFISRLKNGGKFPMFTSCSPGWVRYIEQYEPSYLEHLSSCKSPNQMSGAMTKHYWAPKLGWDPKDVVVVSVMPCIAKKDEIRRPEMEVNGLRDVDYVITTRELARMIKKAKIDFVNLEDHKPEGELAQYTGAGNIFGATGGVMEAALRTVADVLEGKSVDKVEYEVVRGNKDIKEATLNIAGNDVNIAVVHGGSAIKQFFDILKSGEKQYHFVEFMGCTGGCINGGGQPIVHCDVHASTDVRTLRAQALYGMDSGMKLRKSHENEMIKALYRDFLGEPNSHKAHELLHTTYKKIDKYSNFNK